MQIGTDPPFREATAKGWDTTCWMIALPWLRPTIAGDRSIVPPLTGLPIIFGIFPTAYALGYAVAVPHGTPANSVTHQPHTLGEILHFVQDDKLSADPRSDKPGSGEWCGTRKNTATQRAHHEWLWAR